MLTEHPDEVYHKITIRGMAHWAGTGPEGETCRTCTWWLSAVGSPPKRYSGGRLKPRRCRKYQKLAGGHQVNSGIPADTKACKYHALQIEPPPPPLESGRVRKPVRRVRKP